jgi:hypothetical protein
LPASLIQLLPWRQGMEPERPSLRRLWEAVIEKRRHQRLLNNCGLL